MTTVLKPAVTWNGDTNQPATLEESVGYERPLQSLDAKSNFAYCLWHYPADAEFEAPTWLSHYLQCAGAAERMTVELRVTHDDGSYNHWVLGRAPLTGEETERVVRGQGQSMIHPEEVWTAEQAAPLFEQYSRERTIPDWVHRRELDL